ncbi:MAG: SIMPL domain-containing protein [Planctomycetia bacterium]
MVFRRSLILFLLVVTARIGRGDPTEGFLLAPAQRTIAVAAGAEIRVVPDEVHLRFSVEDRNRSLDEAVKACDKRTAAVLAFLTESGVDGKDVRSDFIAIAPQYRNDRGVESLVPEHFDARRGFVVRLREVEKFDALLAGLLHHGAQRVQDVEIRTTELRKHRDLARQKAIRAARDKAVALAGELNAKVGKPQSIQEVAGGGVAGRSSFDRRFDQGVSQNVVQSAAGPAADPDDQMLAAGMISVTSSVSVVFLLE